MPNDDDKKAAEKAAAARPAGLLDDEDAEARAPSTLSVLPNVFAALDRAGRPAAAFPLEGLSGRDRYVGVEVDHERTKKLGKRVFLPAGFRRTKETTRAELDAAWLAIEPVAVPDTPYYRRALSGDHPDLLPGDEATALAVLGSKVHGRAALEAQRKHAEGRVLAAAGKKAPPATSEPPAGTGAPSTPGGAPDATAGAPAGGEPATRGKETKR